MRALHIVIACAGTLASAGPAAAQAEPFVGQTMTTAGSFCPEGWADMNGQILQIGQNTALFSLIGNAYGGNAQQNTFALPTAKPIFTATGVPLRQCIALQGVFPSDPLAP
jgi:microcystin-dependent protein